MKCINEVYVAKQNMWVSCGRCNFCLSRKRMDTCFRLFQELKAASSAAFITCTYADEELVHDVTSRNPALEKTHVQKFIKRVRFSQSRRTRSAIRYYAVGEYGSLTGRPHYHVLLFNASPETLGKIGDLWGHGHVDIGQVEPGSIMYVSGYVINKDEDPLGDQVRTFPFRLQSKGIGRQYVTREMKRWHKRGRRVYCQYNGSKIGMPRYYKDKVFTSLEKQVNAFSQVKEQTLRYYDELERLAELGIEDPVGYYQEKADQAYSRVKTGKHGKL